ncbi:hypothetical protein LTR84_001646 [Exophiala bonariae]|uniref:Xylanolytic transcriptional activator regulatory domain-containing protein n=1 Tax=Exophiala bonariae TaxID=1690606 RepID=A0AAV9NB01_9EURO|nr:hypothetical protein LTR84_001646 [Exophiala bonariae]
MAERSRLNHKRMHREKVAEKSTAADGPPDIQKYSQFGSRSFDHGQETRTTPMLPTSNATPRQRVADSSSMDFARIVIGGANSFDAGEDLAMPDDVTHQGASSPEFGLLTMALYPRIVFDVAIDAYFERCDWFVMLMHRPSFTYNTALILDRSAWQQREVCDVVLVLTVTLLGINCAQHDSSWPGHGILASHSLNANSVVQSLLREIGIHFYEVLSKPQIQSFQILMLLTIFHTYFGSFQFAWNISGVPARVASGLGLHREKMEGMDEMTRQVGVRCWNHALVGELFASMIYGRSSTLNPKHTHFRKVERLQDEPSLQSTDSTFSILDEGKDISIVTFHELKFKLYSVVWEISQMFDSLHLGQSISVKDLRALIFAVKNADENLQKYRDNLPEVFKPYHYGPQTQIEPFRVNWPSATVKGPDARTMIALQSTVLQVLHDSAIIFVHRPLLECRIASPGPNHVLLPDDVPDSLRICVEAALRISQTDIRNFNHHLALSFLLLQQFAAGVILCVPALCLPYSEISNDAKAGVLRIISASRTFKSINTVARHADYLLTNLYERTMRREMDIALKSKEQPERGPLPRNDSADDGIQIQASYRRSHYCDSTSMQVSQDSGIIESPNHLIISESGITTHVGSTAEVFHQDFNSPDDITMSFLQLGTNRSDHAIDTSLNEDLEDAFGAFQQSKCSETIRRNYLDFVY